MSILVSGSVALDHLMVFPDRFANHILPDKLDTLNVAVNIELEKQISELSLSKQERMLELGWFSRWSPLLIFSDFEQLEIIAGSMKESSKFKSETRFRCVFIESDELENYKIHLVSLQKVIEHTKISTNRK